MIFGRKKKRRFPLLRTLQLVIIAWLLVVLLYGVMERAKGDDMIRERSEEAAPNLPIN